METKKEIDAEIREFIQSVAEGQFEYNEDIRMFKLLSNKYQKFKELNKKYFGY